MPRTHHARATASQHPRACLACVCLSVPSRARVIHVHTLLVVITPPCDETGQRHAREGDHVGGSQRVSRTLRAQRARHVSVGHACDELRDADRLATRRPPLRHPRAATPARCDTRALRHPRAATPARCDTRALRHPVARSSESGLIRTKRNPHAPPVQAFTTERPERSRSAVPRSPFRSPTPPSEADQPAQPTDSVRKCHFLKI